MAEKYGVIPKRFTKEWWEYFWMYYKWYVIVAAAVIIAIVTTVYQVVTAPKYDVTFVYAGTTLYSEENVDALEKKLSEIVSDVNGDGKKTVQVREMNFSLNSQNAEYAMSMEMKLQMALSEDETFIFMLDKDVVDRYKGDEESPCIFAPLDDWMTVDVPEEKKLLSQDKAVAVELSGNKLLKECGIDATGKYLCMRFYPRSDQKRFIPGYEEAARIGSRILKAWD